MLQLLVLATSLAVPAPVKTNLIVNGDFSAGNSGFKSDYSYGTDVQTDGWYSVATDPHDCHPGGASFKPHSGGKSMMLVVNGSANQNAALWEQTVKVAPNHKYTFALWAASWSESGGANGDEDISPANLVVFVNGSAINMPFNLAPSAGKWQKLVATWSSGAATTADIRIVDTNTAGFGNDFAVDDIVFHL